MLDLDDKKMDIGDRKAYGHNLESMRIVFEDVRRRLHDAYLRDTRAYNLQKGEVFCW